MTSVSVLTLVCVMVSSVLALECKDFILGEPFEVVRTDAGHLRLLMGIPSMEELDVAVASITLEPRALLLPHYMESSVAFYVLQGGGVVGFVGRRDGKERTVKKELKSGDVYSIPAGTVLYLLNTDDERKLEVVGILDASAALHKGKPEAFFVGGGTDPRVVLSGFRSDVLASAFKVSEEEIRTILSSQDRGAIIHTRLQQCDSPREPAEDCLESPVSNKKSKHDEHKEKKHHDQDEKDKTFNLYRKRMFENEHGWIASTAGEDVRVLSAGRFDVSAIHLKAGSLLAPHWNPEGAQFGMVTNGSGTIQIALSDGSNGVDANIKTGTVFYVPQFLPVSLVADQRESFEVVTFTVSRGCAATTPTAKGIQFLAGKGSVLQKMDISILSLALNLPEYLVSSFLSSQDGAVILPAC